MRPVRYTKTKDEATAIAAAAEAESAYLAGGTTLLDLMKLEVMQPSSLVDVNRLALGKIEPIQGGVRIGAMVRNTDLAYASPIKEGWPLLSMAILAGATDQIRNMATVGGNLMQRTRCLYFRDPTTPCNKRRPGSGCGAIDGENRSNAILGGSDKCIATHPSDMNVALAALDATVHVKGPKGERAIPIRDFHKLPGDRPEIETALEHGELIVAVTLPNSPFQKNAHYLKVRDRASYAFALVSVAAALDLDGPNIRGARVALGGVGTVPWRSNEAEALLVGKPMSVATFEAAATATLRGAVPRRDNAFKVPLAKRSIVRALAAAGGVE